MAKVLIVLDGGYRFSAAGGTADFTYTTLLAALTGAGHQVTRAHRQIDSSANFSSFSFATTIDLLDFDVIWLIGLDGRNVSGSSIVLPGPELKAIARFMAAGGGVFATGDHDSIGSNMCGYIPRVRAMRAWYGAGDTVSPMDANFPRNFPPMGSARADTTQRNPMGNYGGDATIVWFENQSDTVHQPLMPLSPTHPILRNGGADILVYPDHMHEGRALGDVNAMPDEGGTNFSYDYAQNLTFDGETFKEFPEIAGQRKLPEIIATVQTLAHSSHFAHDQEAGESASRVVDPNASAVKTINALSIYDGREAGVGRIVTGSTFHHYVDINLTGDSRINTSGELAKTGPNASKGHGLGDAPATFDAIKAVFVNITDWLARPRPAIQLILERSTFSQAEASANPDFDGAILVTVDGLKPSQFPGGGITTLAPGGFQAAWAPTITPTVATGLSIVPTGVASDDPALPDLLQRFTFTYRVQVAGGAFGFAGNSSNIRVNAALASAAVSGALADFAWIELTKSANPFMHDLANGNTTPWLSSDVRVFPVVTGTSMNGVNLPLNASRAQALTFLRNLVGSMSIAAFEALAIDQPGSALSPFPLTTGFFPNFPRRVYNFAVARVRIPAAGASADDVRIFFRIFTSQTTAALTYSESPPGTPAQGYKRTAGTNPIALPGTNSAGNEWLSFPMFSAARTSPVDGQIDDDNLKDGLAPGSSTFFGALIDNNLSDHYLPSTPGGGGADVSLPTLMMGEHQCIVAQIEFAGTPIPSGSNPFTSDKLAQRNIALSAVANPGLDASRVALHTFEIEATPQAVSAELPPDELLLDWHGNPPDGTEVHLFVPGWNAAEVVALADRFYPRHELRAADAHTVILPGGGVRYVPLPQSGARRTGVISAHLPLGIKEGQRFDLSVRQVTNRGRQVDPPPPIFTTLPGAEAARLLQARGVAGAVPRGVFELGENRVLITDLRMLDADGDHAVLVEHPDAEAIAAAQRDSGRWRETIGAFQLGIPVSVKTVMLHHHLRLLSVLRWRADRLRRNDRWYDSFVRYVELTADKVAALGGNPWTVPATPDGAIPLPGAGDTGGPGDGPGGGGYGPGGGAGGVWARWWWLLLLAFLLGLLVMWLLLR